MKKIITFLMILVTVLALTSCFSEVANADKLEITGYPTSTYVVGEEFDWTNLVVTITNGTSTKEYKGDPEKWDSSANIEVSDPQMDKEGTYTITVKSGTLSATFQYSVLKSYFANGNGTKENPYQISTLAQFKSILREHDTLTYYMLINDISFENEYKQEYKVNSNFALDGNNYSIRNLTNVLFGYLGKNVEIHDLKIYANIQCDEGVMYSSILPTCTAYIHDIDFYGIDTNGAYNNALFGYVYGTGIFENINNYCDFIQNGANGVWVAGIIKDNSANGIGYFINCINYATLISPSSSLFVSNNATKNLSGKFVLSNVKNYGDVISTFVETNVLYAAATTAGNTTLPELNETYIKSLNFYNYKSDLGYLSSDNFKGYEANDKLSLEDIDNIEIKKLIYIEPIIKVTNNSNILNVSIVQGNESKFDNTYIKVVASAQTTDPVTEAYLCGNTIFTLSFDTIDEFNDFNLKGLKFKDYESGDVEFVDVSNYAPTELAAKNDNKLRIFGSYYAYDTSINLFGKSNGSSVSSGQSIYTVYVMNKTTDRPISSSMIVVK